MFGRSLPPAESMLVGDYRFTKRPSGEWSTDWLNCCVYRPPGKRSWRACLVLRPSEHWLVRDGGKPVAFRTVEGAARYLVEAKTERKLPRKCRRNTR